MEPEERPGTRGDEDRLIGRFLAFLQQDSRLAGAEAVAKRKLRYAMPILAYGPDQEPVPGGHRTNAFETDLMIYDRHGDAGWIPLVVAEFKHQTVNSHEIIAYGQKAAAHRSLHPYLRYGLVVGGRRGRFSPRLVTHGNAFDFLAILPSDREEAAFADLAAVLAEEVEAARQLRSILETGRFPDATWLLHRRLMLRDRT